jgi:hypothetical protein
MPATFYSGPSWEQSSGPIVNVNVHEKDVWPVDDNSISGAKDALFDGAHPVVAVGGRTAADGRPLLIVGTVMKYYAGQQVSMSKVELNIAHGHIVRQYVANILEYGGDPSSASTFEQAPIVGQPVFVDDSADLAAGVTLSMSPLNSAGVANPQAGVLWYCQDETADGFAGGANTLPTFDGTLANSLVEQVYCVLISRGRDLI